MSTFYLSCFAKPLMLWVRILIRARCRTLCDKVCQWLATCWWFSLGPPVSSTNKTDRYNITEILLKVIIRHTLPTLYVNCFAKITLSCFKVKNYLRWAREAWTYFDHQNEEFDNRIWLELTISLCANPFALGQVKLDLDKWKLWKNMVKKK
jgi:hypothetical protein